MPDAIEVVTNVLAQHATITGYVKDTGDKMNDVDAIFSVQRETYKVAWSSSSPVELLEKSKQLMEKIQILEDGLKNHFAYEEKVFPLVLGEIVLNDIWSAHNDIQERIDDVKKQLNSLEGLEKDELYAKRADLLKSVNELSDAITNHARSEDRILNMTKKLFEEYAAYKQQT